MTSLEKTTTTTAAAAEELDGLTASQLFDVGWRLQQQLDKCSDESCSKYALERKKAIEHLERAQKLLDELHIFSKNEEIDEVSTGEIRYMLNDALLGWLYAKVNSGQHDVRLVALEQAKHNMRRFLALTRNYELHKFEVGRATAAAEQNGNDDDDDSARRTQMTQAAFDANLIKMAHERSEKIRRYKEQKEYEAKLELMRPLIMGSGDGGEETGTGKQVDEEERRKFFLTLVKYWINKSLDDLKTIEDEISILRTFESRGEDQRTHQEAARQAAATAGPFAGQKPFIITKDALQAKVFGAGYPSVPVYSVEEFYDQLADKGMMPKHDDPNERYEPVKIGGGVTQSQKDKEKAEKDLREDAHDEEELRRQREWDEFKDENKRGSGNTYNRS